jgi:CRISPR-associated protein Cas5d
MNSLGSASQAESKIKRVAIGLVEFFRGHCGRIMKYSINMEIAGPLAMFTRPDTGGTPTSYPVPTWSACKGIFESIAMLKSGDAWICPTALEVCRPRGGGGGIIKFQKYTTNYGGPLRKTKLTGAGDSMQLFATVLTGVCYRLYGEIRGANQQQMNARHYLQELFERRLKQGRCYRTPSLGWREFTCSYWGQFRADEYEVDTDLELMIPSMLVTAWDKERDGQYSPRFVQNVHVEKGVLRFAE